MTKGLKKRKRRTEELKEWHNGMTKGKKEEKIQIAKKLIEKEMPLEEIVQITDLAEDEINEIMNKNES